MPFLALIHINDDHTNAQDMLTAPLPPGAQWVGLFEYPARKDIGCTGCLRGKNTAWTRDPRGFMKCGVCGKRNRKIRQFLTNALFDFLGANLYKGAPAAFRTPEGFDHSPR